MAVRRGRPLAVRARRRRPRVGLRYAAGILVAFAGLLSLVAVSVSIVRMPAALDVTRLHLAPLAAGASGKDPSTLVTQVNAAIAASGGTAAMVVVDLDSGRRVAVNPDLPFQAASVYKLPALMAEAEAISAGKQAPGDRLCYSDGEQEDGWFNDYTDGDCFTLQTIAQRAGIYSDNTAGHMLVADVGGADVLNAYARQHGARESDFFNANRTTASDMAALMVSEASGSAGGGAAQRWLYPLLTHTHFEDGIPAGVPDGVTVIHKIGEVDQTVNDVAIVTGGAHHYVVAILTNGLGGDPGWQLIAQLSQLVWRYEAS